MKSILSTIILFVSFIANGQTDLTKIADCIAYTIDNDTTLKPKLITLDTLYSAYGARVKTEATFLAYINPQTKQLHKIVWNNEGSYYCYVTIYYSNGAAIKGQIKAKYRRTDTNQECETNSIFYYQNGKVVKEIRLSEGDYRENGFWYMSTLNDFITLAGLKAE